MNENENLASFVRAAVFSCASFQFGGKNLLVRKIAVFFCFSLNDLDYQLVQSTRGWLTTKTSARTMCHRKRQSISFYDETFTHIDQSKSNFSLHQFEDNFSAGNCSRRWINENQYQCEGKQTRWHTVRHWVMNISVMRLHMLSSSSETQDPVS